MTNKLNEKKSSALIVAAVISALVILSVGIVTGLCLALRQKMREHNTENTPRISSMVLIDSADGLMRTSSALRLCDSASAAEQTVKNALVYAARAETALECENGEFCDCREKEAFLNDAVALLKLGGMHAINKSDELYALSRDFLNSTLRGGEFSYDGELVQSYSRENTNELSVEQAQKLVRSALSTDEESFSGGELMEFDITRGGKSGYCIVCGNKVREFSFEREKSRGEQSVQKACELAVEIAEKCGYEGLEVYSSALSDGGVKVKMCRNIDGAMCRDECASAFVTGDTVTAFSAGECDKAHTLPEVKVSEITARRNARKGSGAGRLVTTFDGERDRVCYEYEYELEDGVHYLYVCAETGEQMNVR